MNYQVQQLTSEILKRSKSNVNTVDCNNAVIKLAGSLKWYKEIDLFKQPDKRGKWILRQIGFYEDLIKSVFGLLQYVFSLEDEMQKKENCISELYYRNQQLAIDNWLLKQHLQQAIDGYIMLENHYSKSIKIIPLTYLKTKEA